MCGSKPYANATKMQKEVEEPPKNRKNTMSLQDVS